MQILHMLGKVRMTEDDLEDLVDEAIITSLLQERSLEDVIPHTEELERLLLERGWTDWYYYLVLRINIIANLGYIERKDVTKHFGPMTHNYILSPKVREAFDANVVMSVRELFYPGDKQRLLLKMWDIHQ